jgi:hypothetical protein
MYTGIAFLHDFQGANKRQRTNDRPMDYWMEDG